MVTGEKVGSLIGMGRWFSVAVLWFSFSDQNLDLTKRTMVHEGPLSWKVNKDKTIGTLLTKSIITFAFQ